MPDPSKRGRLAAITAVLDRFHRGLEGLPDQAARRLVENWQSLRRNDLAAMPGAKPAELVIGLEQALWDLPMSIPAFAPEHRAGAAVLLHEAMRAEFPEFLADWHARLDRILERGKVRNESDCSVIRAAIDLARIENADPARLARMQALLQAYEARDGRRK